MVKYLLVEASKVALALATLGTAATYASAQPTIPQDSATDRPHTVGVEEIVVTARQRAEREIDVSIATSVITASAIEARGINDISGITQQVPGLVGHTSTVANGGGLSLRGVKSAENTASIEQAVTINFDGVPISYAGIMRLGQFDLGQVELLKGPQALYFGKNSTGGILAIKSANPTDYLDAMGRLGYEFEADQYVVEGFISGPLAAGVNGRLAVRYTDMEGYINLKVPSNISGGSAPIFLPTELRAPGTEEFIVKGALEFDLGGRGSLMLRGAHTTQSGQTTAMTQRFFCPNGAPNALGGIPYVNNSSDCELNDENMHGNLDPALNAIHPRFPADGVPFTDVVQTLLVANLTYDLTDELTFNSITGFYDLDLETADDIALGGPVGLVSYATRLQKTSWSEELRLQSNFSGPFDFATGIFLQSDDYSEEQSTVLNITPVRTLSPYTEFNISSITISPFLEVSLDIIEQLELSGGLRYTTETKKQTIVGVPSNLYINEIDFEDFSPEVTVSYRPTGNTNIYATYRQGYKSGGFQTEFVGLPNALARGTYRDNSFDKETVEGFEVGVKSELFGRSLKLQAAVFSYDYTDLQLSRFDPIAIANILQAIGAASTKGVELSVQYVPPVEGLELYGAVAYTDAVYEDYDVACYNGQTAATGCIPNFIAPGVGGFSGAGVQLPLAPTWAGNVGATYSLPLGGSHELNLNGQLTYSGSYETRAELIPGSRQDSYVTLDLGAALRAQDDRWEIALIGKNLTDVFYATTSGQVGGTAAPGGRADLYAVTNRGREVWVRLTFRPFAR